MNEPDDMGPGTSRSKPPWKVLVLALVVVLVLGGEMVLGIRLLWRKWHEQPTPAKPPVSAVERRAVATLG